MKAYNFMFNTTVESKGITSSWNCIALVKKYKGAYKIKASIDRELEHYRNKTYIVNADNEYNAIKNHVINTFKEVSHIIKVDPNEIYITEIKL